MINQKEDLDKAKALKKENQDDQVLMIMSSLIPSLIEEEEDLNEVTLESKEKEETMIILIDNQIEEKDLREIQNDLTTIDPRDLTTIDPRDLTMTEMIDLQTTDLKEMMEIDLIEEEDEIKIMMITENREDSWLMKNFEFKSAQLQRLFMM